MKTIKLFALFMVLSVGFTSCSSDDDDSKNTFDIEGAFTRDFDVQGFTQRATYTISEDNINYDLSGGFAQTNYDITKEDYSVSDKRWVGYSATNDAYYVIFFKDVTETAITLYKKQVSSLEQGKEEVAPVANDTENYGWNTYEKDLPISGKVENLFATQTGGHTDPISGEFKKFNFETGAITTSDTDWDIAFRATSVIINGGVSSGATDEPTRNGIGAAYVAKGTMDVITSVDESLFVQDAAAGFAISGWYNYTGTPDHNIIPLAGKVIVIKTHDGKFAKVEMLSYHLDGNLENDQRYYTFNYVYQPNEGVTAF